MIVELRPFGRLVDLLGGESLAADLEFPCDAGNLRAALDAVFPVLSAERFSIAVDHALPRENEVIAGAKTLQLLPPPSGG